MKLFLSVVTLAALLVFCSLAAHAQLAGGNTYPINGTENPPTSFATVKSAAAYLNANGVTGAGNVTLEITTGYAGETDTVGIRAIPGADSTRRVIFRPATGFTAVSSIAGLASPNQHAIRLAGASYVTLDGRAGGTGNTRDWTVRCTGTNGQMAVRLDNNAGSMTGIVIRNLIIEGEAASTTGAIFQITGNTTNTMTNVTVEQNLIRSNPGAGTFRGYGITVATASNVANTGLIIRNNVLNQFYGRGINLTGGFPGAKISGNDIFHTAVVTQAIVTEFAGIYMSTSTSAGTEIYNNFIHDIQLANGTTGANGIQTLTLNTAGDPLKVYNNRIQIGAGIQATTFPIHGIYQGGSVTGYVFDVSYNSVYIGGSATAGTANSAAFRKASSNVMNVSNNIFYNARSNSGGTGVHWGIMVNNTTFATISNNDYFAGGSGGVLGTHTGVATGNDSTLAQWYAAVTSDVSSVNQNPNYINPTATPPDLHLNAVTPTQLESGGIPIAGIITDFDGDARNAATPDIGSDEGIFTPLDLTPPAISYTALGHTTAGTVQALTATVIDPSGVPTAGTGRPVAYWKRNTGGTYAGATGTFVSGDNFTFSFGAGTVIGDTVFYFVAAQDSNNNVGVSPSLGAGGFTPNPPAASTPPTNPSWYVARPTLAGGSYTVGTTSGTYQTLKAAFDAINGSIVTGNITLSILSQGTSESATAELGEVSSGPGGPFVITVKPATSSSPTITGSIPGFLVKFSGADNVTIDGANTAGGTTRNLTLSNTATTTNTGVVWVGSLGEGAGASNITIKNANIIAGRNGHNAH